MQHFHFVPVLWVQLWNVVATILNFQIYKLETWKDHLRIIPTTSQLHVPCSFWQENHGNFNQPERILWAVSEQKIKMWNCDCKDHDKRRTHNDGKSSHSPLVQVNLKVIRWILILFSLFNKMLVSKLLCNGNLTWNPPLGYL